MERRWRLRIAGRTRSFGGRFAIAVLATGALAGCNQDTFDPKDNWNYLVCTMGERKQPEHVAFAVQEDGKAVAAYLRKIMSATVTPFEIVFESMKTDTSRNGASPGPVEAPR